MGNAAIDYERQEALNMARMQPPKAGDFSVPQDGSADNYSEHRRENFHVPQRGQADNYNGSGVNDSSINHAERLDKARQGLGNKSEAENVKNLAQDAAAMATPMGAFSLMKQINPLSDIPYFAAMGAAVLKDVSDLVLVGSLPGLGTVISICASIFIFMMMLLVGSGEKRKMVMGLIKRGGVLFAGTLMEFLPGLNFVPIETITIVVIYFMTLSERAHSSKAPAENKETGEDEEE